MSGDIAALYGGQAAPTQDLEPAGAFEPMPAGWYSVEIEKAEVRSTKAGTGKYLWLEMTVIGEACNGRKLFPKVTLQNPNAKAQEIGLRELAGLEQACGLNGIGDSSQFIQKQIDVRVKVKKGNDGFDDDNDVTAYAVLGSQAGKAPAASRGRAAPAAAPARAWDRAPAAAAETPPSQPAAKAKAKLPWE